MFTLARLMLARVNDQFAAPVAEDTLAAAFRQPITIEGSESNETPEVQIVIHWEDLERLFDEDFHLGLLRLAGHDRVWPTVVAAKGPGADSSKGNRNPRRAPE